MTQQLDIALTEEEIDLTREFMMLTCEDEKDTWTTDDLRTYYGLNSEGVCDSRVIVNADWLLKDPAHAIGALAMKWRVHKIAVQVKEQPSEIESNNRRKIDVNMWGWSAWQKYLREHFHE